MSKIKIALGMAVLMTSLNAAAIPTTAGHTNLSISGDLYTFTFDEGFNKDIDSLDGLLFSNGDISWSLYAEAFSGSNRATLRQDWPGNGGLGVMSGSGTDNWEGSEDETIRISLSDSLLFDLVGFTVNGGNANGDHGDCVPDGNTSQYKVAEQDSFASVMSTFVSRDGCTNPESISDLSSLNSGSLANIDNVVFSDYGKAGYTPWTGYLESLTIRVDSVSVPSPSVFALFALGLIGLGVTRRRRQV